MSLDSKCTIASRLAQFLRKNGDKVINGTCKLSLTTSALCLLNTLFWDMLDDEGRYTPDLSVHQESEVVEDIQFLYSFIKRTTTLKLFHGVQTLRGGVDLSHFTNLTVLELRKIPAHLIIGLNLLSERLKALICSRSIYLLKELFVCSMDGSNVVRTWTELKELNLSYNYLESLDQSLRSLPNIETLDLSHNHIRNTEEIQVLKNLIFVNLSFNELDRLPVFSTESCRHLTKLYLRNNNLENLEGLECLFNLEELDIAYNLLSEYHVLSPLDNLKSLNMLNLEGNPIFFHTRHIMLVAVFINPIVLNKGLHLNGRLFAVPCIMTPSTDDFTESMSIFHHQTSINTVVGDAESTTRVREASNRLSRSPSDISEFDNNSISSVASQIDTEEGPLVKGRNSKKVKQKKTRKKGKKMQEALITEPVECNEDYPKRSILENIPRHLKAKQIMEARRQERGESWLIPDLAHQNLTASTPKVPSNTPVVNSPLTLQYTHAELASILTTHLSSRSSQSPNTTIPIPSSSVNEMAEVLDIEEKSSTKIPDADQERLEMQDSDDDIEILGSDSKDNVAMTDRLTAMSDNLHENDIYGSRSSTPCLEENDVDSDEESEDSIFFVESIEDSIKRALSVTIGPKYIREKDVLKGKYLENLDLSTLVSVSTLSTEDDGKVQNQILLEFDSVKSSKQKRIYLMEDLKSAEVMSKILQPFADAKTLRDVTIGALECLKCNSQFSKQAAHKKLLMIKKPLYGTEAISSSYESNKEYPQETDACPNCGNHILVQMETLPLPTVAMPPSALNQFITSTKGTSDRSPDTLSNGSASSGSFIASLFSSIKISPILKRKSAPALQANQNQDSDTDKITLPVDNDSDQNDYDPFMRRNSSDITIISNPSQSSLTVFPDLPMEINLNTIIERDSQASLSPTFSQDNTFSKLCNRPKSEQLSENAEPGNCDTNRKDNLSSANVEDNDFYSLTESLADQSDKPCNPNEVMSSGSENYQSPQSPNRSKSADLDESSQLINLLGEKVIVTQGMFSELDHRVKLHLEINVFGKKEEFEACLQTSIVPLSTGDEFKGLFTISSRKLYIIKFLPLYDFSGKNSEPMEKMIQIIHSCPLGHLRQVKAILGNQGLTLFCGASSHVYTLIIRDADICNSFSSLLSELTQDPRFEFGKVEFFTCTSDTLHQLQSSVFSSRAESDEMPEVLLHLFAYWWSSPVGEKDTSHPVCVIITQEEIFISKILYKKQDSFSDVNKLCIYHYTEVDHQKISDLISLKLKKDLRSVEVNFLNESSSQNSNSVYWTITMDTKSSLFSFINAVKNPWEEVFKVPLPLTTEEE